MCELVHKINCRHKPPGLENFSLQQKEGKDEKNLYDHDYIVGTDSLHNAPNSDGT
jgi:hypothetical protein